MERQTDDNDLTEGVIWKKLLLFFFPILFGMLLQQLYNTADAIIVGKFVGTDALAAVGGSATQIINLVIGFFTGLASGATVIVSQYYGAHDDERVSLTVHTILTFYLIVGIGLTILGYLGTPWMLKVVKNPVAIMEPSVQYLRIYFLGALPMLIFNVGSGILRAVGDSKYSLWKLINLQFNLLTCMTTLPLRVLTYFGMGAGFFGFLLSLYIIVRRLCPGGDNWGNAGVFTLFAVTFILCGIQMIGIGVIGEYIGRIYTDVRARPRYFIEKIVGRKEN